MARNRGVRKCKTDIKRHLRSQGSNEVQMNDDIEHEASERQEEQHEGLL
jgi:hypothetical protein